MGELDGIDFISKLKELGLNNEQTNSILGSLNIGNQTGGLGALKLGANMPTYGLALKGLGIGADLFGAWNANKALNVTKDMNAYNMGMANKNFNLALDAYTQADKDRFRTNTASRGAGMSGADLDEAVKQYAATRNLKSNIA